MIIPRGKPDGELTFFFRIVVGVIITAVILTGIPAESEGVTKESKYLTVTVPDTIPLTASGTSVLSVDVTPKSKWHINTGNPSVEFLIPTRLTADTPLKLSSVNYPRGEKFSFVFSERTLRVYKNKVTLKAVVRSPEKRSSKPSKHRLILSYQPCSKNQCLPPEALSLPYRLSSTEDMDYVKLNVGSKLLE